MLLTTSTASGKSLVYTILTIEDLLLHTNHLNRYLYIFPTKALAQDQKQTLRKYFDKIDGLSEDFIQTLDGDTKQKDRIIIKQNAQIILTNPDMLHHALLPYQENIHHYLLI